MLAFDHSLRGFPQDRLYRTAGVRIHRAPGARQRAAPSPRPGVAEPESREKIQRCQFRSVVGDADLDADVFWTRFGIFDENIEVSISLKRARVEQLEFGGLLIPGTVLSHQPRVRKLRLRVFVQIP